MIKRIVTEGPNNLQNTIHKTKNRDRDRMVVGLTTIYAIIAYHH